MTSALDGPVYGSGLCGASGSGVRRAATGAGIGGIPGGGSRLGQRAVRLRPAVAVELPDVPHLADQVEVEVGQHDVVGVALADGQHLAPWVAEVALAVELADPPRLLVPRPVDRPHEVGVGHRV